MRRDDYISATAVFKAKENKPSVDHHLPADHSVMPISRVGELSPMLPGPLSGCFQPRALHNAVSALGVKQTAVWVFVSIWLEDHR